MENVYREWATVSPDQVRRFCWNPLGKSAQIILNGPRGTSEPERAKGTLASALPAPGRFERAIRIRRGLEGTLTSPILGDCCCARRKRRFMPVWANGFPGYRSPEADQGDFGAPRVNSAA